jgi:hypothetical protein
MATMSQKHSRKARKILRGFKANDPIFQNSDSLHDLKLKRELMKMMMEAHMQELHEQLPPEQLEGMTYRWLDDSGKEWETRL